MGDRAIYKKVKTANLYMHSCKPGLYIHRGKGMHEISFFIEQAMCITRAHAEEISKWTMSWLCLSYNAAVCVMIDVYILSI